MNKEHIQTKNAHDYKVKLEINKKERELNLGMLQQRTFVPLTSRF